MPKMEVERALELAKKMAEISNRIDSWVDFAACGDRSQLGELRLPFGGYTLRMVHIYTGPHNEVKVTNAFMPKGMELDIHKHNETEFLIVYLGHLVLVHPDGRESDLPIASSVHIPPGERHGARALEDTWMIGITIPGSPGYPDDPRSKRPSAK